MSTSTASMEAFFAQRGFGQRLGFGERPAVLAIDFMRAFTDPSLPLGSDLTRQIQETRKVLQAARGIGAPIFYTVVYYDEAGLADSGIWGIKMKGVLTLRGNTPEVELDPRLGYRDGEAIILKKYASAFFGTDLVARLNARRVDTLLITGCTTSGCVRASAVDAVQNGFRPIVLEEAVGDRAEAAHTQSLFDLNQKYADVVPVAEGVAYLEGLPRQPRPEIVEMAGAR